MALVIDMLVYLYWPDAPSQGRGEWAREQARNTLGNWVAAGLEFEPDGSGGRLFDPAEVGPFAAWLALSGRDPFWFVHAAETGRRQVEALAQACGASTVDWSDARAARFHFRILRRFKVSRGRNRAGTLRLRAPLPMQGAYHRDFVVRAIAPEGALAKVQDGRLEVRLDAEHVEEVTIGADIDLIATLAHHHAKPTALTPEEHRLYLGPREGWIDLSPRIRELSTQLGRGLRDFEAVRSYVLDIIESFAAGTVPHDPVPTGRVDWLFDQGWYDCESAASFLVSLCRARDVPARIVSGFLLYPAFATPHFWTEAWIEGRGWTPFDTLCWRLSDGGRDPDWRERFSGQIDWRLQTGIMPRQIMGPIGTPTPERLQVSYKWLDGASTTTVLNSDDGGLVFQDRIWVEPLGPL